GSQMLGAVHRGDVNHVRSSAFPTSPVWNGQASGWICRVARGNGSNSIRNSTQVVRISSSADGISCESAEFHENSIGISMRVVDLFSISDGISRKTAGNALRLTGKAAFLVGFSRKLAKTDGNPDGSPRKLINRRVICREIPRFQQERAPFRRTKRKIRRQIQGKNLGVEGIQTPVDRAQACSSKHPDGYREVPF
ncbi:MAG TPA: hypothetical protein VK660_10640, partial [Xanthomonadaceae bacterium]|nr:hypothetical protein [Xanthomonadaceae bacterium]